MPVMTPRLSVRTGLITLLPLLVLALCLLPVSAAYGQGEGLRSQAAEIIERINESPLGEPILVESFERDGEVLGEIHALVPHGIDTVSSTFAAAANWCDIVFLHLNVKACVPEAGGAMPVLRMYLGRKHFQTPDEATLVELQFRVVGSGDDYLATELSGESGPHGSGDFRMELEAVPSSDGQTLLRFRYSLELGFMTGTAMSLYFSTAGGHRVGFSTDGENQELVGGLRGMIERNAMRFYLGLQAYLDALDLPEDERQTVRLERWFDLTERYPEQLRELDRETYLEQKQRELEQQRQL